MERKTSENNWPGRMWKWQSGERFILLFILWFTLQKNRVILVVQFSMLQSTPVYLSGNIYRRLLLKFPATGVAIPPEESTFCLSPASGQFIKQTLLRIFARHAVAATPGERPPTANNLPILRLNFKSKGMMFWRRRLTPRKATKHVG